jgi:DNA mismatch repair ATPase MutL
LPLKWKDSELSAEIAIIDGEEKFKGNREHSIILVNGRFLETVDLEFGFCLDVGDFK